MTVCVRFGAVPVWLTVAVTPAGSTGASAVADFAADALKAISGVAAVNGPPDSR